MAEQNRKRFDFIQVLRGLGSISILLYHINVYIQQMGGTSVPFFNWFDVKFSYAAILFLSISGFLMSHLMEHGYSHFLIRRLIRIYPMYFLVVMLSILLKCFAFGGVTTPNLLKAITLLPFGEIDYPLFVEWTLIYEVFFYFMCYIFIRFGLKRIYPYFLVIWSIFIIVGNYYFGIGTSFLPTWKTIGFSLFNLSFTTGGLIYYLFRRYNIKSKWTNFIFLIGAFLGVLWCDVFYPQYKYIVLALAFSMMIYAIGNLENILKLNYPKWLLKMGNYSYTLYLSHVTLITICFSILISHNIRLNILNVSLVTLLCLLVGGILGIVDEKMTKDIQGVLRNKLKF